MAVMATPPPIDSSAFAPLDQKTQSLPQTHPVQPVAPDAMAIDTQFDGMVETQPQTNGHTSEPAITEPITHVSSGIEPTAPFLPDPPAHLDAPFDPAAGAATPTIATSVEQPISDVRDEPIVNPPEPLVEQTQAMDINQEQDSTLEDASAVEPPPVKADEEVEDVANLAADTTAVDETALPSRPASNGPEAMAVDPPTSGQVRPREEDEEDLEPSAKRTKVDSPPVEGSEQATAPPTTANGSGEMPPPQSQPLTLPTPKSFDTSPMTDAQRKFLQDKVRTAMKTKASYAFNQPVDPVALGIPTYTEIVTKPMDMGTMLNKLKDSEYKNVDEFMDDFETMVGNSFKFNGSNHPVSHAAMSLRAYFVKMMDKLPKADAPLPEKKPKKPLPPPKTDKPRRESRASIGGHARSPSGVSPQNTFPPDPTTGMPLIRRDSTAADGRPKREIHRPPPRDLPYTSAKPKRKKFQLELKFAKMVVDNMLQKTHMDYSYPFLNPVDPVALNIPTYHKIIKKPMDMGTVNRNLKNDAYSNAKEVHTDIKLVFENCYKFNPPTDAVNQMGKRYEKLFDGLWSQKDQWIAREKAAEKGAGEDSAHDASDGSEDETEEEDGEDEKAEKIRLLQEQVRALTASIQDIAGEPARKKSPKTAVKKAAKTKAAPKAKKTAITLPPLAKPAKKAPKIPQYNLSQKRVISETISNFNADYMQQAVDVIRRLYPQGISDGEEMELDVEELPNEVLHELWKLVKKFQKANNQKVEDEPVDEDYEPPTVHARPGGPAKPRKNKPMNAREQEAKIKALAEQLGRVQNGGSSGGSPQDAAHESSDDDDDDASESEEE